MTLMSEFSSLLFKKKRTAKRYAELPREAQKRVIEKSASYIDDAVATEYYKMRNGGSKE